MRLDKMISLPGVHYIHANYLCQGERWMGTPGLEGALPIFQLLASGGILFVG